MLEHRLNAVFLSLCVTACATEDDGGPADGAGDGAGPSDAGGQTTGTGDAGGTGSDTGAGTGDDGRTEPPDDDGATDPGGTDTGTDGDPGTGSDPGDPGDTGDGSDPGDAPDFREPGPFEVTTETGSAQIDSSCEMTYDIFRPDGDAAEVSVVLSHGFMGGRADMAGLGEHWASWGITVVTPDLCHATIDDADHPQNGKDLEALAEELELGEVVFSGFSAGGLASVLAATDYAQATALLGLDMVDSNGSGADAANAIDIPAHDLVGEPSQCNDSGNGVAVFQGMDEGRVVRLTDAVHCDFEQPGSSLCALTCSGGGGGMFSSEEIQRAVLGLSTAYVAWQSGADPSGEQWWTPGRPYWDEMADAGLITEL